MAASIRAPLRAQPWWQASTSASRSVSRRWASTSCGSASKRPDPSSLPPIHYSLIPHHVPYALGLALQERLYSLRGQPEVLLLLEHKPVYTEGRRGHRSENDADAPPTVGGGELSEEQVRERFASIGADYHLTQRGGLITYHGPGQLIGYPIVNLGSMGLSSRCYIEALQRAIRSVLTSHYQLPLVEPPENNTGVWSTPYLKICSIGVQVRHRITTHGFGLNVTREVAPWFRRIVACGIKGRGMTSIEEQLEDEGKDAREVSVKEVMPKAVQALGQALGRDMVEAGEELLRYEGDERGVLSRVWVKGEEVTVPTKP